MSHSRPKPCIFAGQRLKFARIARFRVYFGGGGPIRHGLVRWRQLNIRPGYPWLRAFVLVSGMRGEGQLTSENFPEVDLAGLLAVAPVSGRVW